MLYSPFRANIYDEFIIIILVRLHSECSTYRFIEKHEKIDTYVTPQIIPSF